MFWESQAAGVDSATFLTAGGTAKTYSEIFAMADELYANTRPGVVAILCEKSLDTILAYVGALRNNLVPLMLDAGLKPKSFQRNLAAYNPDYIFSSRKSAGPDYTKVREVGKSTLFATKLADQNTTHPDLALLLPTSGSTGDPKCVRLSHNNLQSCTDSVCDYLGLKSEHRAVTLLPLHYSYGLSVLHNVMNSRASLVVTELSVLDRGLWELIETQRITEFSGVPFIFEMLRRMRFSDEVLNTLRCVTQAGGRLDPKLTAFFVQKFATAGVKYFTMYGQTEASPRISYLAPERATEKHGSIGIPITCGTACIAETREKVGEGELLYSGPNVCLGYAETKSDLALGDMLQGELLTGDQVRIDTDGFIFFVGRRKRFVKLQGISVNLDHMEGVLKNRDIDCLVIGTDNKIRICYLDFDIEEMARIVESNFSFHPSAIKYILLDELPINASGKPDYAKLTSEYL